jgi:hypothetical protein
MRPRPYRLKLALAAGILGASFASGSAAFAKPALFTGSGTFTFVTANFSYDGAAPALVLTGSENTNRLGFTTFQTTAEDSPTVTSCTAPDGSAGTTFDLVQTDSALISKQGILYISAVGATAGSECVSNSTGAASGNATYTVTGGTGKLTGASGSLLVTFTSQALAAPGSPPGSNGIFGAGQFSISGSLTK